jgi:hypothetical protein
MNQSNIVTKSLPLNISRIIQISAPDLFEQCSNDEDIRRTALSFSNLLSKEFNLVSIYTIIPTKQQGKDTVAYLTTVDALGPFTTGQQYLYYLDILWFQDDFSINVSREVIEILLKINFEDVAHKENLPF